MHAGEDGLEYFLAQDQQAGQHAHAWGIDAISSGPVHAVDDVLAAQFAQIIRGAPGRVVRRGGAVLVVDALGGLGRGKAARLWGERHHSVRRQTFTTGC